MHTKKILFAAILSSACVSAGSALAADYAGAKRLICATLEAMDCTPGAACHKGAPGAIGAPPFMRIDLEEKTIAGPKRTTPIVLVETDKAGQLLLQGTEVGYGWTVALDPAKGAMAATMVNGEGAFVLFGTCMPL